MLVVSDTTPIISLLKIHRLHLLEQLFGIIKIPKSVFSELTENPRYEMEATAVKSASFIQVVDNVDSDFAARIHLSSGLDIGESEAIALSYSSKTDILLMDEMKGRQVATSMGIKVMGTIGILALSYEDGRITKEEIQEAIHTLKGAGRHISERLYQQLTYWINTPE